MERLRDFAVVLLLLVITGLLGHLTGAVTDNRAFSGVGSVAFICAVLLLVAVVVDQIQTIVRESRESRRVENDKRAEAARARSSARPVDPVKHRP